MCSLNFHKMISQAGGSHTWVNSSTFSDNTMTMGFLWRGHLFFTSFVLWNLSFWSLIKHQRASWKHCVIVIDNTLATNTIYIYMIYQGFANMSVGQLLLCEARNCTLEWDDVVQVQAEGWGKVCVALLKIEQVEICQGEVNLSRVMLQREGKVWVTTISILVT